MAATFVPPRPEDIVSGDGMAGSFVPPSPDAIVQDAPDNAFTSGVATRFGYNDPEDNGVGAWGTPTNNPTVVGVSLSRDELRKHFGDEDKAKGAMVEVVNPQTGSRIVAPIVDKGPAGWVEDRQGPTIDLTHAADEMLGGTGKTPMQWRIVGAPQPMSAQTGFVPPRPEDVVTDGSGGASGSDAVGFVPQASGDVVQDMPEPEVRMGIPVNPSMQTWQAMQDREIPPAEPIAQPAIPVGAPPAQQPQQVPATFVPPRPEDVVDGSAPDAQPAAPAGRPVGFWEALGRSAASAGLAIPQYINTAMGTFPYLENEAIKAVTGKDLGIYDNYYRNFIAPSVAWRKSLDIQPGEDLTLPGQIGHASGTLLRDIPLAIATDGLGLLPEATGIAAALADEAPTIMHAMRVLAPQLKRAAVNFIPTSILEGADAGHRSAEAGGSIVDQATHAIAAAALTDAAAIVPMGAPSAARTLAGRVIERGAKGFAVGVPIAAVTQQAQALIDGRSDLSPDWKQAVIGAIPMAALAAITGGRVTGPESVPVAQRGESEAPAGSAETTGARSSETEPKPTMSRPGIIRAAQARIAELKGKRDGEYEPDGVDENGNPKMKQTVIGGTLWKHEQEELDFLEGAVENEDHAAIAEKYGYDLKEPTRAGAPIFDEKAARIKAIDEALAALSEEHRAAVVTAAHKADANEPLTDVEKGLLDTMKAWVGRHVEAQRSAAAVTTEPTEAAMPASVNVPDTILEGDNIKEVRAAAKAYAKAKGITNETHENTATGWQLRVDRDTLGHLFQHEGAVQIHIVPSLPEIIRDAVPSKLNEPHRPDIPEIVGVHRLVRPVTFRGKDYTVKLTVKEHVGEKGHHVYDVQAIDVNEMKPAGKGLPPGTAEAELRNGPAAGFEGKQAPPGENVNSGTEHPDGAYMPKPPGWVPPAPEASSAPGEAFTREQATLPRAVEWLRPETKGNPSPTKIRNYLMKALDVPIRAGMRVSKGAMTALGVYRIRPETIRMRALNDIPTLLHEVGHYLHHMVFPEAGNRGSAQDFGGAFDSELMPLGAKTSTASYTARQVRMEGVAEWFRTWAADPAAARALAPNFTNHFEAEIHANYPQMEKILAEVQRQVRAYIQQPSRVKAEEMIEWDDRADGKPLSERLRSWYTAWVHELAPIERAMRELESFGLPADEARRVAELANNFKGGWKSKAEFDLEHEQMDLNGNVVGPGLKQILTKLRGHEVREFSMYAALKRAEEKRAQGLTTGFEAVMAGSDYPAMMREWAAKYEKQRKELVKFTENQMLMMEQSGFFTPAQLAAMRAMNQDYVPFHRIVESMGGGLKAGKTGQGFVNTDAGVRRFKGSDLMIADPVQSVIRNNMVFRELAERNRIGRLFVEAVRKVQGGGRVGETVLKPMKPTKVNHDEVISALEAAGINTKGVKAAGLDLGFTIFRAAQGVNGKDGVFRVWIDGKEQLFQVGDRDLLRALTMMDTVDSEAFARLPGLKTMAKVTSVLRTGATLTPEFILRNPFRDQVIAGVFSAHGYVPFWDGFRGVLSMLGKDHLYESWVKSGGKYGGLYDLESGNQLEVLQKLTRGDRNAMQQAAALANPLNVLKALRYASELMETGTRLGEFRRAKLAGKSDVEAANASRDVTLNFARSGYKGQVINKVVAFFNAAIQDMDKMQRTFRERPVSTTLKSIAMISVPSALVWWLGKDDEKIQSLSEWRKAFFWNINMKPLTGEDFILSVPKPFLMGALFGTSVEKGLDYVTKRDPNAVNKWFSALIQNTLVRGDLGIATAFKPLVEDMANYSFFKDGPLQDSGQMKLSPGLRANPDTSVSARWLGERVGVSPILIDNTVRGYFGGLGRYGTNVVDWAMMHTGLVDVAPQPQKDWRSLPGIKGVVVGPDEPAAYVSRFYRAMDIAEKRILDYKEYGEQLRRPDQAEFWKKNRNELAWYGAQRGDAPMITQLRRVRDQLGELNKAAAWVVATRTMNSAQKAERLRQLQHQRDVVAKSAFDHGFHPTDRNAAY